MKTLTLAVNDTPIGIPSGGRPEVRRTSGITPPPDAAGAAIPVMPEVILTPPRPRASVCFTPAVSETVVRHNLYAKSRTLYKPLYKLRGGGCKDFVQIKPYPTKKFRLPQVTTCSKV